MASDINSGSWSGRLTGDAELTYTPNGQAICKFSLACGDEYKDRKHTSFLNCVLFGKRGEALNKYLTKGTTLFIVARVKIDSYEAKDGSGKRYRTEFIVNDLAFGGNGNGSGSGQRQQDPPSGYDDTPEASGYSGSVGGINYDDDIPFAP